VHDRQRDTLTNNRATLIFASSDHSGVNDYSSPVSPPPAPYRRPAPGRQEIPPFLLKPIIYAPTLYPSPRTRRSGLQTVSV
jgi:hypothetical protein